MSKLAVYVFIISFVVASIFQGMRMSIFDMIDIDMWADQPRYVQTGDFRQFDAAQAYGHPGGPIIEGVIVMHDVFKLSYSEGIVVFLTLFNALIIALVCVICFILKKDNMWWIVVLGTLSLNRLYNYATPPTAVVSPLIVLLCLFTLYLYEKRERIRIPTILFWGFISGLTIATRADIGVISTIFFLILLKQAVSWKNIFLIIVSTFLSFAVFDPFMWYMPIRHVWDLVSKILFHYAEYATSHMSIFSVLDISGLAFVSIFLATLFIFIKRQIKSPLPTRFTLCLLAMTVVLYFIFLTAHYQAARYYQPILFIWEAFLPLFLFSLVPKINLSFLKTPQAQVKSKEIIKVLFVAILVGSQSLLFFYWFL